jgi:hypothetical protein
VTYRNAARVAFGLTAVLVLVGLIIQISLAIDGGEEQFSDHAVSRVFNVFCFFTVQSNIIVGITCLLLAMDLDRDSAAFRMFRLAGVIDIAITGVVYHVAIASLHELDGKAAVADQIAHTIVPIVGVVGWLVFGPRGLASRTDAVRAMVVPLAWLVFTMVRGPIVDDWYPYEFMEVPDHGYPRVLLNIAIVAVLFAAIAAGAVLLDRLLTRRQPGPVKALTSPSVSD